MCFQYFEKKLTVTKVTNTNFACSRIFTLHILICFTLVLEKMLLYVCTYLAAVLNSLFAQ